MTEPSIQTIVDGDRVIAYVIKAAHDPSSTQFVTDAGSEFQVGFVRYPTGGTIPPHKHKVIERNLQKTSEVLVVRSGSCHADLFNYQDELVYQTVLAEGDILVLLGAGHGFRMIQDTVFLEVKQGPYTSIEEKTHLEPNA